MEREEERRARREHLPEKVQRSAEALLQANVREHRERHEEAELEHGFGVDRLTASRNHR